MGNKIIVRMIERRADANSAIKWESPYIEVVDAMGQPVLEYSFMCSVIGEAIGVKYLRAVMADIESVEASAEKKIEEATEGWVFTLSSIGVHFEGEYGQGSGGDVSLSQFKLAVQTFLQFLGTPGRKPIEVNFPER